MIQPIVVYKCVCDNCKATISFGENFTYFEKGDLEAWIDNEEWSMQVINGQHICDACIVPDIDGEVIIDKSRTKITANDQ